MIIGAPFVVYGTQCNLVIEWCVRLLFLIPFSLSSNCWQTKHDKLPTWSASFSHRLYFNQIIVCNALSFSLIHFCTVETETAHFSDGTALELGLLHVDIICLCIYGIMRTSRIFYRNCPLTVRYFKVWYGLSMVKCTLLYYDACVM